MLVRWLMCLAISVGGLSSQALAKETGFVPSYSKVTWQKSDTQYTFHPDGTFDWLKGKDILAKGEWKVVDQYLILVDKEGSRACLDNEFIVSGVYIWKLYKGKIHLSVAHDNCDGRQRGFLHASPFTPIVTGR
ncbi:MAG: hypothetical protein HRU19_15365 [Pseudobacteriovorax sp.]|nr:hypothetical protein [Pseudobacteriovorax sp.]